MIPCKFPKERDMIKFSWIYLQGRKLVNSETHTHTYREEEEEEEINHHKKKAK